MNDQRRKSLDEFSEESEQFEVDSRDTSPAKAMNRRATN